MKQLVGSDSSGATVQVNVRFRREERAKLQTAADRDSRTLSEWCRLTLLDAVKAGHRKSTVCRPSSTERSVSQINVRFRVVECAKFQAAADSDRRSLAAWCRLALLDATIET